MKYPLVPELAKLIQEREKIGRQSRHGGTDKVDDGEAVEVGNVKINDETTRRGREKTIPSIE